MSYITIVKQKYPDFNWNTYILLNKDLSENGILTELAACKHWILHGIKEKRKYKALSYSQLGQDLEVLKTLNNKRNGYFIEIGANDGIQLSNTYLLETMYDWTGICIEPIPDVYNSLVKNRPKSLHCNRAIFSESNKIIKFDIANKYNLLSGISEYIDCHTKTVNKNKTQIEVLTLTFNDLLIQYNAPAYIDYLSLDTEGSELEILKSVDLNKYTFGLIDVEHNYIEPRRTQIRELLEANGYEYIKANNFDDCYKHKSLVQ
jgi:FkbM family methyltransferase